MAIRANSNHEEEKRTAALFAVKEVKNGDLVGLGTGSTATYAIEALGQMVKDGLQITATASSKKSANLAIDLGLKVVDLSTVDEIDISIDGADEFTSDLNLIKGGGGALFREKIMAALSKNTIIIADSTKKVETLGAFSVPIEVVPIAFKYVLNQVTRLGAKATQRVNQTKPIVTDNGNYLLDADFGLIEQPHQLATQLNQIDGLLVHGLFLGITRKVIMADNHQICTFT